MLKPLAALAALLAHASGTIATSRAPPPPPPPPCTDKEFAAGQCMRLVRVAAADKTAVCLDGSPGVFYWHPATDPKHKNDWILSFKGDGWCFDAQDCLGRSKNGFGGSDFLANFTRGWNGGELGGNDKDFGGFNKVILENCDGASLTGDVAEPLLVRNAARPQEPATPIYFRGRHIRDAIFDTLLDPLGPYGMAKAENVLLTGCSSGGLAAYLHSDWAHALMKKRAPKLKKFKTLGVSGFFLQHDSVQGKPVYQTQVRCLVVVEVVVVVVLLALLVLLLSLNRHTRWPMS